MKLNILSVENFEMVHYYTSDLFIAHKANKITFRKGNRVQTIKMPGKSSIVENAALKSRKARRLLRLDKAMILYTGNSLLLFRAKEIWRYTFDIGSWEKCDIVLNCRNPMYNGILQTPDGGIFFGEYGNPTGEGKRIFKSSDNGLTWKCVYTFKPDEIRHIHCLSWDPYKEKIWVLTGDSDNECKILCCNTEFTDIEIIGQGKQVYRACHVMFSENTVDWVMDSPLETVKHVKYDRKTGTISLHDTFAGPVWFAARLDDGTAVAASAQEIGPSHIDRKLHLYASSDMEAWTEIASFKHDGWPKRYFRFGTICISKGNMCTAGFYMSCEGVKGLDGKSVFCRIDA